jgi:hypothetical protein
MRIKKGTASLKDLPSREEVRSWFNNKKVAVSDTDLEVIWNELKEHRAAKKEGRSRPKPSAKPEVSTESNYERQPVQKVTRSYGRR